MPEKLYAHPFSKEYWREAAGELRKTRVLIFAALMIALRVAFKTVSIPIAADLRIGVGFLINAYGAMVMGPVVAMLAAAVTDTLGYVVAPNGIYFFPFILTEMAGSLVFALFFYRTKITVKRVMLSRFCIDLFVNVVLTTPIMMLYYAMMLGKSYKVFNLMRILKNMVMFPIESVLLVVFLRLTIPPTRKQGWNVSPADGLRFTKQNIALLAVLFLAGMLAVACYAGVK